MEKDVYIHWDALYSINIEKIDEQHKKWFQILNNFYKAFKKGQGQLFVMGTLKEFFDYTQYHFAEEEKLFKKYNYPQMDAHIKTHKQLIWEITHMYNETGNNNIILSLKTIELLKDWLIKHILTLDKAFGEFVRQSKNESTNKSKNSTKGT